MLAVASRLRGSARGTRIPDATASKVRSPPNRLRKPGRGRPSFPEKVLG